MRRAVRGLFVIAHGLPIYVALEPVDMRGIVATNVVPTSGVEVTCTLPRRGASLRAPWTEASSKTTNADANGLASGRPVRREVTDARKRLQLDVCDGLGGAALRDVRLDPVKGAQRLAGAVAWLCVACAFSCGDDELD